MKKPLSFEAITALANTRPVRENFGPQSDYPYLAFRLMGSDKKLAGWLCDLPCPVIGIGNGALADACDVVLQDVKKLSRLIRNIENAPYAAMVLIQHLRASKDLTPKEALTAESFAYSTLQTGSEFRRWYKSHQGDTKEIVKTPPIEINTIDDVLTITLSRPDTHNGIDITMRDALCEGLDIALADKNLSKITINATGNAFSIGGAVEEFGSVSDPVIAHWIRSMRSPAWRLVRLRQKLHVHVNGAAIGAGAEMAAFGANVTASLNAWFQLPELKYGLLPGAGGTVSLPLKMGGVKGRQRTAYMALSMERIKAQTALDWGLIDAIVD